MALSKIASAAIQDASVAAGDLASGAAKDNFGAGAVLQVVQIVKTDTWSISSTPAFTDVTGMAATITPSSASSKILVLLDAAVGASGGNLWSGRMTRNGTVIYAGAASGSNAQGTFRSTNNQTHQVARQTAVFLDTPGTTAAVTYKLQLNSEPGSYTTYLNRSDTLLNDARSPMVASSITLMEIAG